MAERKEAKAEKDEAEKYQKLIKEFVSFSWCFNCQQQNIQCELSLCERRHTNFHVKKSGEFATFSLRKF